MELLYSENPNKINDLLRKGSFPAMYRSSLCSLVRCVEEAPSDRSIVISSSPDQPLAGEDSGLRRVISRCAEYQWRVRPNLWTNAVMRKLSTAGVRSKRGLNTRLHEKDLNYLLRKHDCTEFHPTTLRVLKDIIHDKLPQNDTFVDAAVSDFYGGDW